MWNSVLRYIAQSYLNTTISCMLNLMTYSDLTLKEKVLTPFMFVYATLIPIVFYKILNKRKAILGHKDMVASIGTLYMNQDTFKQSVVHYIVIFIVRRYVFAMTIAFVSNIVAQLYITIMCSLLTLWYLLVWWPMDNRLQNMLAVFNECVLLISCYLLFLYTDYVPTPEMKYDFGDYLLYVLYIDFGLNFILLIIEIVRIIKMNVKRILLHRKLRKARQ
jgi:hypothetical protein